MTNKRVASLVFFCLVFSTFSFPALAQDLNKLLERSTQLWALRLKADKARAAEFVEREARANFPMHEMAQDARVEAIEFTADKTKALVRTKAQSFIPQVGKFELTIMEPWVWTSGNWFLHVELAADKTPFVTPVPGKPTAVASQFTLIINNPQVDLGTHVQGEPITGSLRITAPRSTYRGARVLGAPTMRLGQPQWIDENNANLPFTLDTTLISKDIDQEVEVEATGLLLFEEITSKAKLKLTGKIEGRLSVVQLEQTPGARASLFVELELRNVTASPFRLDAVRRVDTTYMAEESVKLPVELPPGQSVRLPIQYMGTRAVEGEVVLQLSPGVMPKNDLLFRIRGGEAPSLAGSQQPLTRAELDNLVRGTQREAELERIRQQK